MTCALEDAHTFLLRQAHAVNLLVSEPREAQRRHRADVGYQRKHTIAKPQRDRPKRNVHLDAHADEYKPAGKQQKSSARERTQSPIGREELWVVSESHTQSCRDGGEERTGETTRHQQVGEYPDGLHVKFVHDGFPFKSTRRTLRR